MDMDTLVLTPWALEPMTTAEFMEAAHTLTLAVPIRTHSTNSALIFGNVSLALSPAPGRADRITVHTNQPAKGLTLTFQ